MNATGTLSRATQIVYRVSARTSSEVDALTLDPDGRATWSSHGRLCELHLPAEVYGDILGRLEQYGRSWLRWRVFGRRCIQRRPNWKRRSNEHGWGCGHREHRRHHEYRRVDRNRRRDRCGLPGRLDVFYRLRQQVHWGDPGRSAEVRRGARLLREEQLRAEHLFEQRPDLRQQQARVWRRALPARQSRLRLPLHELARAARPMPDGVDLTRGSWQLPAPQRRGSQAARQRFAKPSYVGSNPIRASKTCSDD